MPDFRKNPIVPKLGLVATSAIAWVLVAFPVVSVCRADDLAAFNEIVRPLFAKYCFKCHSEGDPNGNIDLSSPKSNDDIDAAFEAWKNAVRAVTEQRMPPEKEAMPTAEERSLIEKWYKARLVDNVISRPGPFRPRRLSAREYRNTLRSLFGFDLRSNVAIAEDTIAETSLVMKLLPTDPPGPSRYRNDTYSNPLTPVAWDAYSQLVDSAIDELFSTTQKTNLELLAGIISADGFAIANAEQLLRLFESWARSEGTKISAQGRLRMSDNLDEAKIFYIDVDGQQPIRLEIEFGDFHEFNVAYYCGLPIKIEGDGTDANGRYLITKIRSLQSVFGEKAFDAPG